MGNKRSPLKDKPLRNPGQSVSKQRFDLAYDKVLSPMFLALFLTLMAGLEWWSYFNPRPPSPFIYSFFALVAIGYAVFQGVLAESTGKTLPVWPVVLFPGWYIEDNRTNRRDLWVLEPKALSAFLAQEKVRLAPEDVALAAYHLSRFIRAQEHAFEAMR